MDAIPFQRSEEELEDLLSCLDEHGIIERGEGAEYNISYRYKI